MEMYQYTIDESAALDRILSHCLTEVADGLLGLGNQPLDRPAALDFLGVCGHSEETFWAYWRDAQ